MDRLVSLSVGVDSSDDFAQTFQDLSELARNLGATHSYVSVSASDVNDGMNDETDGEDLYHDQFTLNRVRDIIKADGLTDDTATKIIDRLHNAGIVFRERMPS